jgi:hypothetical protein
LLSGLLTSMPDHVFVVDDSMNIAVLIGTCLIVIRPFAPSFFLYPCSFYYYHIGGKR